MARTAQAIVKWNAIFVKERKDGRDVFVKRPYDIVEYNWGQEGLKTYIQPCFGRPQSRSERNEVYDDIRFYNTPPVLGSHWWRQRYLGDRTMADVTGDGLGEPASHWFAISPDDSNDLAVIPRGIYVGVTGAVAMRGVDGVDCTFVAMPVGFHPVRPRRILSTGTAATNILGLY